MSPAVKRSLRQENLAELISLDNMSVAAAGRELGLTKGETARAWAEIKRSLGSQVC